MLRKALYAVGLSTALLNATTLNAEEQRCTSGNACTIDVLVAYTDAAAQWTTSEGDGLNFSCEQLLAQDRDDVYSLIKRIDKNQSEPQEIKHPCLTESGLGSLSSGTDPYLQNLVEISMAELNQIYANSDLHVSFNLVGTHKLQDLEGNDYVEGSWLGQRSESERSTDDLARWGSANIAIFGELIKARNEHNTPEAMQLLSQKRQETGADIVVVLVGDSYGGINVRGIASAVGVVDDKNAYTVLQVGRATAPAFAFSHEVSHLMGAGHYKYSEIALLGFTLLSMDAANSYGYDYARSFITPQNFATIMGGQANSTIIPFLSNVDQEILVNATGERVYLGEKDDQEELVRDNSKSILAIAPIIEEFGNSYQVSVQPPKNNKVGVDFGYSVYDEHDYTTQTIAEDFAGVWNNLTDHRRNAYVGDETNPVLTQSGERTDIRIEVTSSFSGKNVPTLVARAVNDFGTDEIPTMAMSDGFYALSNWNSGKIKVSGLDKDQTYTFEFYGSGSSSTRVRKAKYEITAADESGSAIVHENVLITEPNFMRTLKFEGIRPQADGSISIKMSGHTNWVWHTANLNAMQFWPE